MFMGDQGLTWYYCRNLPMKVNLKIETRRAHGGVNKTTEQRTLLFKPSHIGIQLSDGVYKYTYLSTSEAKLDQISEI